MIKVAQSLALLLLTGCLATSPPRAAPPSQGNVIDVMAAATPRRMALSAVAAPAGNSVSLAWNPSPSSNATSTKLYQAIDAGPFVVQNSLPIPTTTVAVPNLIPGWTNTFYVTAVTDSGLESVPSNMVLYQAPAGTNPPPPITATISFTNATPIIIPSVGAAPPYPSKITVAGASGTISNVEVTVRGFFQTYPGDVDIVLVGPGGQKAIILSDVGEGYDVNGINLTLSDLAAAPMPEFAQLVTGTFKPTDASPGEARDVFPAPAPAKPYATNFSVFKGLGANGVWSLYVQDDGAGDVGSFANGWSLELTMTGGSTNPPPNTPPTITDIPNRTNAYMFTSTTSGIPLTIGDFESNVSSLVLTVQSSNPGLVPAANITLSGSGKDRTLTAVPVANKTGRTTITVTVSDGLLSASDTFDLIVAGPALAP